MDTETKALAEAFQQTLSGIRGKFDEISTELKKRGSADPLTTATLRRLETEHEEVRHDLNQLFKAKNRPRFADIGDRSSSLETKANREFRDWFMERGVAAPFGEAGAASHRADYTKAFNLYLSRGKDALGPDEIKTLAVGSNPDGGFYVEPFRAQTMVTKIFDTSPVRQVAASAQINSNIYTEPIDRDQPTSGWVGEQTSRPTTATPQIGLLEIPVHEVYAMPVATQNILDDGGINVEDWLNTKVADKLGREESTAFVTGDGTSKPKGFTKYPVATTVDASRAYGTLQYVVTGVSGNFKPVDIDINPADDLLNLIYQFKADYRRNLQWAGTRITLGAIRAFKDQQGRYIYQPQIDANGVVDTVFGFRWNEFQDMADYTTSDALGVALADWQRAYMVVDRLGIRMIRDPYTTKGMVQFYTTKRVGGAVRDSDAIKFLKFGTS